VAYEPDSRLNLNLQDPDILVLCLVLARYSLIVEGISIECDDGGLHHFPSPRT